MILKTLKEQNIKIIDFIEYSKLSKTQFDYAIRKNDPIYLKGLESKFKEYIDWKIKRLQDVLKQKNTP